VGAERRRGFVDMIVGSVGQAVFSCVLMISQAGGDVDVPWSNGRLQRHIVVMAVRWVDTRHTVTQRRTEVRSKQEVDDEVCRRTDDDQHVADVICVGDGVGTAERASLVSQDSNRYLQSSDDHLTDTKTL